MRDSNRLGKRRARERDPEKYKRQLKSSQLKNYYGITLEQYDEMYERQQGLCAICDKPETKLTRGSPSRLAVDHCHKTGLVRGLLCSRCNRALGWMHDDTDLLRKAVEYLETHSKESN